MAYVSKGDPINLPPRNYRHTDYLQTNVGAWLDEQDLDCNFCTVEWLDCDRGHAECYLTECTKCLTRDYDCEVV